MSDLRQLAQVNIGRLAAPLDSPRLAAFVGALEEVNAVADAADGFVWRFQEGDDATSVRVFDDEWMLVNMSVWRDRAALDAYVYGPEHRAILRRRREFFERPTEAMTALWWIPAGHRPTVAEAEKMLVKLRENGASEEVWAF